MSSTPCAKVRTQGDPRKRPCGSGVLSPLTEGAPTFRRQQTGIGSRAGLSISAPDSQKPGMSTGARRPVPGQVLNRES